MAERVGHEVILVKIEFGLRLERGQKLVHSADFHSSAVEVVHASNRPYHE